MRSTNEVDAMIGEALVLQACEQDKHATTAIRCVETVLYGIILFFVVTVGLSFLMMVQAVYV